MFGRGPALCVGRGSHNLDGGKSPSFLSSSTYGSPCGSALKMILQFAERLIRTKYTGRKMLKPQRITCLSYICSSTIRL